MPDRRSLLLASCLEEFGLELGLDRVLTLSLTSLVPFVGLLVMTSTIAYGFVRLLATFEGRS